MANEWGKRLKADGWEPWPDDLESMLARCHAAGQDRPTPLVLRYGPGGYNTLHQDLYGDVAFPLQVVIGLTEPGVDYTGGEFVLTEQRPRSQTRATAIVLERGEGIVLPEQPPARAGLTRYVPGDAPPRRQRGALGCAGGAGADLPRRPLSGGDGPGGPVVIGGAFGADLCVSPNGQHRRW